jgi:hypothetical protein
MLICYIYKETGYQIAWKNTIKIFYFFVCLFIFQIRTLKKKVFQLRNKKKTKNFKVYFYKQPLLYKYFFFLKLENNIKIYFLFA